MDALPILKKAYMVKDPTVDWDFDSPTENWDTVYAKTAGQAKILCSESNGFLTTKAKRAKHADIVLFEGLETQRWRVIDGIKEKEARQSRIDKVMRFDKKEMFYVQKGYVGNCCNWWREGNHGYSTNLAEAALYTRDQILSRFIDSDEKNQIWVASHVNTKVSRQVDSQHLDYNFKS